MNDLDKLLLMILNLNSKANELGEGYCLQMQELANKIQKEINQNSENE